MTERWSDREQLFKIYVPLTPKQWDDLIANFQDHNAVVVMADQGIITFIKKGSQHEDTYEDSH